MLRPPVPEPKLVPHRPEYSDVGFLSEEELQQRRRRRVEVEHTRSEKLTQGRLAQREQLKLQLEMERKMLHKKHAAWRKQQLLKFQGAHADTAPRAPRVARPPAAPKDARAEAVIQHGNGATAFGQLAHSVGLTQSLYEWLASLGGGCEKFAPILEELGYQSVYDVVEASPRPEELRMGGIDNAVCRRQIWQATQQLQLHGKYRREVRLALGPGLASARRRLRRIKVSTPRVIAGSQSERIGGTRVALTSDTDASTTLKLPDISKSARSANKDEVRRERKPRREVAAQSDGSRGIRGGKSQDAQHLSYRALEAKRKEEEDLRVSAALQKRQEQRDRHEEARIARWDEVVEPWKVKREEEQARGRWVVPLERAKIEQQLMRKERENKRRGREELARTLLKDMGFVMEQTSSHGKALSEQETTMRLEWQKFIDQMEIEVRGKRMDSATLEEVKAKHRAMLKHVFLSFDEDDGGTLDRHEVQQMARGLGHKLSEAELQAAMDAMDGDGGGDVSFPEFYAWWNTSKGKADGPLHIDTSSGAEPYTITIVRFR